MNWNNGCYNMMDYGKIVPSIIGRKESKEKEERMNAKSWTGPFLVPGPRPPKGAAN
jgi:hypothetical protein